MREPSIFDHVTRLFKPDEASVLNNPQQETHCEGDHAREARTLCRLLNNRPEHNSPHARGIREAYRGREADYLYGRFGGNFGWNKVDQARDFYRRNR